MAPAPEQKIRTQPTPAYPQIDAAATLSQFEPIGLQEMDAVTLQDRTDTKYVFHVHQLGSMLAALADQYRILEIEGRRSHHYHTLYFDTADFALYHQHHAGGRKRYKVRSRQYVDTGLSCVEVKFKNTADRTIKSRITTPTFIADWTPEASAFAHQRLPAGTQALEPRLRNDFSRITLVSKRHQERLTIDTDLHFDYDNRAIDLTGIVVAEVKQAEHARASTFIELMRERRLRATGFSKYCIGVSLLYPQVKHNNFKPQHRMLDRLMQGEPS